jgi:short-subunit dehydrogenase involved in D-alanine esterification of teichoic acids
MADPAQKVVLVTGGTSGIGLALACAFRADGVRVIVCGRDAERLAEVRKALPDVTAIACDVSDRDQARRLIDQIAATDGRLDVLVNNAGLLKKQDFTGTPDFGMIEAEINTNLLAPINLTGLAMPLLRAAAPAWIVMITSSYALAPATRHRPIRPLRPGFAPSPRRCDVRCSRSASMCSR